MRVNQKYFLFGMLFLFLCAGCSTVNKGLDKTAEGAKEVGKPVGKVMNIPEAVAEGAVNGMDPEQKNPQDNPYNR